MDRGPCIGEFYIRICSVLQDGLPIVPRPYAAVAAELGVPEGEAVRGAARLCESGLIRSISGIFHGQALGYSTALVAGIVPEELMDGAAAKVSEYPGVSHNYARAHRVNLWFTVAVPPGHSLDGTVRTLAGEAGIEKYYILPVVKAFKIEVKLPLAEGGWPEDSARQSRPRPPSGAFRLGESGPLPPLSDLEVSVVREIQEHIPPAERPFLPIARRLDIGEEELLAVIKTLAASGRMRRLAAVLAHRRAGYRANGMGIWKVPGRDIEHTGMLLAADPRVTHCYARQSRPEWPYSIYTMVHAGSREECLEIYRELAARAGRPEYEVLFSTREYAKRRPRYFVPDYDEWYTSRDAVR
ncbi:MAG: Lrp/AsnC family transcriptional regulator [Planctomycetota bacterium]|nr:Lrp/AsnC family transcriptional regulator [Planctomycetota bacterium]